MFKLIKLWIVGSAVCVSAGWILSALHELTAAGYAVFFLAAGLCWLAIFARWRKTGRMGPIEGGMRRPRWPARRLKESLPVLFLLTAMLAVIGGIAHAPNNYDGLTYRFPRMLHWWAASHWHWILTDNERMNLSGTNFEWLSMPLFVFTHSDRLFFLINIVAYLFMPSLVFGVFNAAGASRRTAWMWMWMLPMGFCYAMQAGSISNDTIAGTYFLSAIYFAFRARQTGRVRDVWLCFLSTSLFAGIKGSNLPLLLPIAWVVLPAIKLVRKQFAASVAVCLASLLVSYLPSAVLNKYYTGDWFGDPHNIERIKVQKPLAGLLGNGLQLGLQCMEPPFLPVARTVEAWAWNHFPTGLQDELRRDFPRFAVGFRELPQEESAGLGIGIATLAIISLIMTVVWRRRFQGGVINPNRRQGIILGLLTWVALIVYMIKLGSEATSRLLSAYYPLLLLPILLSRAQDALVRRRWYRAVGVCAAVIALAAVILTPSRPLWPAKSFFDWAVSEYPENAMLSHARTVYDVYRKRNDLLAELRASIPEPVKVIGLVEGGDDPETSLWRPFGERRVVDVPAAEREAPADLPWLVVKNSEAERRNPGGLDRWIKEGAIIVESQNIVEKAGAGPQQWTVLHFPPAFPGRGGSK